jgi:hypothetical protein
MMGEYMIGDLSEKVISASREKHMLREENKE